MAVSRATTSASTPSLASSTVYPEQPKEFRSRLPHCLLIFDKEDRFPIHQEPRSWLISSGLDRLVAPRSTRQVDFEYGAHRQFAVYPDESFVLLHDSIDRCQSESRAFAQRLSGIEGLEDVGQMFGKNSGTIVADGDKGIASGGNHCLFAMDVVVVE